MVHRCEKGWKHQAKEERQFDKEEMSTYSRNVKLKRINYQEKIIIKLIQKSHTWQLIKSFNSY